MEAFSRITMDPDVMGGKPTITGTRVTVGTIVGMIASGHSIDQMVEIYPYLKKEDIKQALQYAAWRADEYELPIDPS